MRGGADQGIRRWLATCAVALTIVCFFSLPAIAVDDVAGTGTAKTTDAPAPVSASASADAHAESVEVHVQHLSETLERLDSLRGLGIEVPEVPELVGTGVTAPRVIIISNGTDTTIVEDSIYAVEITADAGGVDIVDTAGRHLKVIGTSVAVAKPPIVHGITGRREDIFHMFSDVITIEPDEVINGDVVAIFGGRIVVLGKVNGSVSSIFGTVDVQGTVEDAAIAPFGSVHIGPTGRVGGDVVASEINKEPGGRIGGLRNELFFKIFGQDWQPSGQLWLRQTFTAVVLLKALFWVFLVLLAHALAARNVAKVKARLQRSFFKCFFMGLLIQILFIPAVLVLLVTIIGIPVAIFLLPLMVVAALVLSHAAVGLFVGEKINENTALPLPSPLAQTVTGLMTVQMVPLLAVVSLWLTQIDPIAPVFRIITFVLIGLSLILGYVVITLGIGAVTMTRFGTRPKDETGEEEPEGATPLPLEEKPASAPTHPSPLPRPRTDEPGTASAT